MIDVRRALRTAFAAVAVVLFPLAAVAPASATPLDFSVAEINCNDYDPYENSWANYPLVDTTSVTVTLTDCGDFYLYDESDTTNASVDGTDLTSGTAVVLNSPSETLDITGEVDVNLAYQDGNFFTFHFYNPDTLPDPDSGVFLGAGSQVIGSSPAQFTVPGDPEAAVDLGDGDGCGFVSGDHAYTAQKITVTKAGTYTFRVVSTDPQSSLLQPGAAYTPTEDTFLMIAGEFDDTDPAASTFACDDDLQGETIDGTDHYDHAYFTTDGDLYHNRQPYLVTDLQPGNYTLVFTFWGHISSANWDDGTSNYGDWTPTDATFNFDVWGPEGGAQLVDEYALASTGVDPSFGLWTGLALAGTGVAITVARRRAQRA